MLIFAPLGRDAEVAAGLLRQASIPARICGGFVEFESRGGDDACFALATEEAMSLDGLRRLSVRLSAQPAWSDLPFIILTRHGGGAERNPGAALLSELLGNVTFLERPFHPTTFISVARSAFKGRQRQYEARARIEELKRLSTTLEIRVAERTRELEHAHAAVLTAMEQRQRAEEQLRQAQKMEMIGQLTGGVAHDFNNLLMAVLSYLELLRKNVPRDPKMTRLIDGAMQGAKRGATLTQRLLAFARRQDLQVEPRNLADLVRSMTELIERSVGPQIEVRLDLQNDVPLVVIDGNQIELALLNLVVNARDAMPAGGVVTIVVDQPAAPRDLDLPRRRFVRLAVRDTGVGMDAETLRKATEPFFSTKELGKGTGLGLSMIQGLAAQLDGALRLTSEPGRGTVGELWLPAAASVARMPAAPAAEPATPDGTPKMTILVVDDDALIAASTAGMLEDLGHEVIEANSPARALEILRNGRVIDLLITDYLMPKMNGAELATAAREVRPGLPVLVATGFADMGPDSRPDLPRLGKPYHQAQLAAAIARLVGAD